jgi:hypothetical protein
MCSEEDPSACHRRLLVGRVLAARGVTMHHIRGDGRVETNVEGTGSSGAQLQLFGARQDDWRSVAPVPRRNGRNNAARLHDRLHAEDSG